MSRGLLIILVFLALLLGATLVFSFPVGVTGGGEKAPDNVLDPELYLKVKRRVKSESAAAWPNARASARLVQEYKKAYKEKYPSSTSQGYKGKRDSKKGVARWLKEKWVDACVKKNGKHPPCGNSPEDSDYPYCRPTVRVTNKTPTTLSELKKEVGADGIKKLCKKKQGFSKIGKRMKSV